MAGKKKSDNVNKPQKKLTHVVRDKIEWGSAFAVYILITLAFIGVGAVLSLAMGGLGWNWVAISAFISALIMLPLGKSFTKKEIVHEYV